MRTLTTEEIRFLARRTFSTATLSLLKELDTKTLYATPYIAIGTEDAHPVYVYIGPQKGVYYSIDGNMSPIKNIYEDYDNTISGYKVIRVSSTQINELKERHQKRIEKAENTIKRSQKVLASVETLKSEHPELLL